SPEERWASTRYVQGANHGFLRVAYAGVRSRVHPVSFRQVGNRKVPLPESAPLLKEGAEHLDVQGCHRFSPRAPLHRRRPSWAAVFFCANRRETVTRIAVC